MSLLTTIVQFNLGKKMDIAYKHLSVWEQDSIATSGRQKDLISVRKMPLLNPMRCSRPYVLKPKNKEEESRDLHLQSLQSISKESLSTSVMITSQIQIPKRLQQTIIFYIIYFFCHRGRKNLHAMTKETFKVIVEPDGTEYVVQSIDEQDKNHTFQDTERTNEGRMYATNSKYCY